MAVRLAVLDLDGTLLDGFLAASMLTALTLRHSDGTEAAHQALSAIQAYKSGVIDHDECAARFYPSYARAVHGLPAMALDEVGRQAWQQSRPRLFPHATELVAMLQERGFLTCLLSGSPEEAVTCAADELNVDRAWGLRLAFDNGRCTGQVVRAPALPGAKRATLLEATDGLPVNWSGSLAVGDSSADIDVLEMTGTPLAFEPDPVLRSAAEARNWQVTDRRSILRHCRSRLDEGAPSDDPHGDTPAR
ncbi:HAD family hydrolase [Streptomyces cyaneofuscatus]|uniref:HAD family hydrolase n=1 Tax=Streptomyces cyaneofuscatus TaxID=66883 RepID=UPI00364DC4C6